MHNIHKIEYEEFKTPTQFGFNWKEWLVDDDYIATSYWIIPDELTKEKADILKGTITSVFVSGDALGKTYVIENIVVTSGGTKIGSTHTIEVYKER